MSNRLQPINPEAASEELKKIYQDLQKKMGGKIYNVFLNMGNSPAVLKGYLALSEAEKQAHLSPKLKQQIALVVSQDNTCQYCLAAHTQIAKSVGLQDNEIMQARQGQASEIKTQAILKFAKLVSDKKGKVSDQDVAQLKEAGVNEQELVEITLVVLTTLFTNYFNNVTDPQVDFPLAPAMD